VRFTGRSHGSLVSGWSRIWREVRKASGRRKAVTRHCRIGEARA
jgi:hypothetical protein